MIITDKNTIVSFLSGETEDFLGRTYGDILRFDDYEMEKCHSAIQQIFPLHEQSKYAETYPILTLDVVDEAKQHDIVLCNLRKAKDRFEKFLAIGKYEDIDKQRKWCNDRNHNLLRITRIIRCLRIFGLVEEAEDFFRNVYKPYVRFGLSQVALKYWEKAHKEDVFDSLQD